MEPKSHRNKLLAALFESGPIEPRHDVPSSLTGDWGTHRASEDEHQFFSDFDLFADAVNAHYSPDEHGNWGGPWRLQELPDTELDSGDPHYEHLNFGRRYSVFFNQAPLGTVEISALGYNQDSNPQVSTIVTLKHVRLLPFGYVAGLLKLIAYYTACGSDEEYAKSEREIHSLLLGILWDAKRNNNDDDGSIELSLIGLATKYLTRKAIVLKNRAAAPKSSPS
jgi:hypothetical protein